MRRFTAAAISILSVGLMAACTGHSHGASSGPASGVAAGLRGAPAGTAEPAPANVPGQGSSAGGAVANDAAAVTAPGPSLIRIADMTVASSSVGRQADRARAIVVAVGGSVDGDNRSSGPRASATMTLRVPPVQLAAVLSQLSALGHEQSRHLSTQDVTTQVVDVDSRVQSALAAITRLRTLYARATRVSDVIAIESELAQREADLESLQAQQRALAGQVAMATVTLYLVTPAPAVAHPHTTHGFVGGLIRGWHAFTGALTVLVTGVGAVLPFATVLAVGAAAWLFGRRRRPRSGPAPTAGEPVS